MIPVILMESANIPVASENVDTMNLINTQDNLKANATTEKKQTIEVLTGNLKIALMCFIVIDA